MQVAEEERLLDAWREVEEGPPAKIRAATDRCVEPQPTADVLLLATRAGGAANSSVQRLARDVRRRSAAEEGIGQAYNVRDIDRPVPADVE